MTDYLCFSVGDERQHAIAVDQVHAIITTPYIHSVVGTLPYVVGVFKYQDRLIPVIDLIHYDFGVSSPQCDYVVVVEGIQWYGILVDRVYDLYKSSAPTGAIVVDVLDLEHVIKNNLVKP